MTKIIEFYPPPGKTPRIEMDKARETQAEEMDKGQEMDGRLPSGIVGARSARLELAELAFEDEPVRARVAHAAVPEQQCRFTFDELE
ncbi:MAG: hypothetical protein M1813_004962 [Trichoglossum hirsutum]|nr:MAG: hypothetical protein M1813_004962 [Trichoglossum hirsutum]